MCVCVCAAPPRLNLSMVRLLKHILTRCTVSVTLFESHYLSVWGPGFLLGTKSPEKESFELEALVSCWEGLCSDGNAALSICVCVTFDVAASKASH